MTAEHLELGPQEGNVSSTTILPQADKCTGEEGRTRLPACMYRTFCLGDPSRPFYGKEDSHPSGRTPLTAGVTGAGALGMPVFILQDQSVKVSSSKGEQYIQHLKDFKRQLEKQVHLLAELLLKYCWRLHLFLLKKGGLCPALGEKCWVFMSITRGYMGNTSYGSGKLRYKGEGEK